MDYAKSGAIKASKNKPPHAEHNAKGTKKNPFGQQPPKAELLAPLVNLTTGNNKGRYSWWISDEGAKARVDIAKSKTAPATERDRLTQYQSPLEPGLVNIGTAWAPFAPAPATTTLNCGWTISRPKWP